MSVPFQFLDFQAVASRLAQQGGEAELRSAVGRLYYALFHVAWQRTRVKKGRDIHKRVISEVKKRDGAAGNQLDSLRRLRNAADYDLVPSARSISPNWQSNWQKAQTIASHILPKLGRI